MPRRPGVPPAVALRIDLVDRPEAIATLAQRVAVAGGRVRTLSTVRRVVARDGGEPGAEVEIEVEGLAEADVVALLEEVDGVRKVHPTRVLEGIFGKRIIVIGGGAQVGQVAMGAISEADRHNIRGERISVDTIPLVGEQDLAAAVRAVVRLTRVKMLVLAGSIMGGDITEAVKEVQAAGMRVISLNMVGTVPDVADLVVTDPVQAGVMAVMAIADTARFDIARQLKRRY